MHAIAEIAIWRLLVVVFVSQMLSIAFAIWWLTGHPSDLQNAFMPATISLALLAVFRPAARSGK